jgi:non-ribosomal peptide synthetase component F
MLGVLKAGGAFVPLDPSHPTDRLRSLVKAVEARILLCSSDHAGHLESVTETLMSLHDGVLKEISAYSGTSSPLPGVTSHSAAYIIFTSGSTGVPKVRHESIAKMYLIANLYRVFW